MKGPIVVLGGGLSGIGAAYALARAGASNVTLLERGAEIGGLAGTFVQGEHFYPLAYHHILHRDRTLLYFLQTIGALRDVRWRKIRMLFRLGERLYNLAHPLDFARFPMKLGDKLAFVRLMRRSFAKEDWSDWAGRTAAELVDGWGTPGVRRALFEPLTRLKFDLPCSEVSAAWLGARLHFREGSAPLGYIPGRNWTKVLCDGLGRLLQDNGVRVRVGTTVDRLLTGEGRVAAVELSSGERLPVDQVVSTLPTEIYLEMVPEEQTPGLRDIRYTAIVSAVCATQQRVAPEFYWMNLASLDCHASGIFLLDSLNPTIGSPKDRCVNFTTHVPGREAPFFRQSDEHILAAYAEDFRRVFGADLRPAWTRVNRLPLYSPIFRAGYRNPPVRSTTWRNVYFAGNYRTFPSIASTGTALWSGLQAAEALSGAQERAALSDAVRRFRLRAMPRG